MMEYIKSYWIHALLVLLGLSSLIILICVKINWIFVSIVFSLLIIIFVTLIYVVKKTKDNEILNKNYTEASISLLIGLFVTFSINALNTQNELQNKFVCKQSEQLINDSIISLVFAIITAIMIVVAIIRKSED